MVTGTQRQSYWDILHPSICPMSVFTSFDLCWVSCTHLCMDSPRFTCALGLDSEGPRMLSPSSTTVKQCCLQDPTVSSWKGPCLAGAAAGAVGVAPSLTALLCALPSASYSGCDLFSQGTDGASVFDSGYEASKGKQNPSISHSSFWPGKVRAGLCWKLVPGSLARNFDSVSLDGAVAVRTVFFSPSRPSQKQFQASRI